MFLTWEIFKVVQTNNLLYRTQNATRGDAAWPEWTKISYSIELIYKSPIRAAYVVFAPFPGCKKKQSI